jgi:hypothetical protein
MEHFAVVTYSIHGIAEWPVSKAMPTQSKPAPDTTWS